MKSKQSFLFISDTPWIKKGDDNFYVGMGAWDGAESTLYEMRNLDADIGLYRDDGLLVAECSPRNIEKLKKEICAIFHSHRFKITIDANRKQDNFLDITLNLEKEISNLTSSLETPPSIRGV